MAYSRYATLEERRNIRKAFLFVVSTIVLLVLLVTIGIPILAKFAAFVSDLKGGGTQTQKVDTTPPGPPHLNSLPDFTNKKSLSITGTSEPGATVVLSLNDQTQETLAGNDGNFSYTFDLNKGSNTISALSKDSSENKSQKTPTYTVVFNTEAPNLEITSPSDGTSFSGSKQRQVTISGKTSIGSSLTANDRLVKVNDDGTFSYTTTLSEGDNVLNFKATDQAGNTTEKSITLKFSP